MRIRTIKPEFWQDEDMSRLSEKARLLAIGLLNHSDDEGYFNANEDLIRSLIFPYDSLSIHGLISELSGMGYIEVREATDGKAIGWVKNFKLHQVVNRPKCSTLRPLFENHGVVTESSLINHDKCRGERKGKEGKGTEGNGSEDAHAPQMDGFTIEQVRAAAVTVGVPEAEILKFFHHFNALGWVGSQGRKIKNLASALSAWMARSPSQGKLYVEAKSSAPKIERSGAIDCNEP